MKYGKSEAFPNENYFLTYMHPYVGRGRATLAIAHWPETGLTVVGVSYASPKDRFTRKKGRMIAEGRISVGSAMCFDFYAEKESPLKAQVFGEFIQFTGMMGPKWANQYYK